MGVGAQLLSGGGERILEALGSGDLSRHAFLRGVGLGARGACGSESAFGIGDERIEPCGFLDERSGFLPLGDGLFVAALVEEGFSFAEGLGGPRLALGDGLLGGERLLLSGRSLVRELTFGGQEKLREAFGRFELGVLACGGVGGGALGGDGGGVGGFDRSEEARQIRTFLDER